jgi:ribonuclease BN (tRNA processing enzyme)
MAAFSLCFVGTSACVPSGPDQDSSCMVLDHSIMIDTGWNGALAMLAHGEDPNFIDYLFITHCHQDHYLGLPALLFSQVFRHRAKVNPEPLHILGPLPEIKLVVERALHFLRTDVFDDVAPAIRVIPLRPSSTFSTPRFQVSCCSTLHPVSGLCYRFTEHHSGKSVVFSGDTAFLPSLAQHAHGCDLLVHECSNGAQRAKTNAGNGHSGAPDAADIAALAQAKRLALTHYNPSARQAVLAAAQAIFPNTLAPLPGERLSVE